MSSSSYIPEISYGDTDPNSVVAAVLASIESALGRSLYPGDPVRLLALAFAAEDINLRNLIDEAGRQNLLAYATGSNLDALGDLVGVSRIQAIGAQTTLQFTASAAQGADITIPKGTRVSPGNQVYFATDIDAVIPAGQTTVTVTATAVTPGAAGNGYVIGEINQIVDPVAYVPTVTNTTATAGGCDTEEDDPYRQRIRLGIARFSVAGPSGAYEYWAKTASTQIADVYVTSSQPGYVDIYVLQVDGQIPGTDLLNQVAAIVSADDIRPLTDYVQVHAPTTVDYTVNLTYYIRQSDAATASSIQAAVTQAVDDWVSWQKAVLGRDINPSQLVAQIINAGAKRVDITSPVYTTVADTAIAILNGTATVTYGGLEDE